MTNWSPISWQDYSYIQVPTYSNMFELEMVVNQISNLPPLVTSGEIDKLKQAMILAGRGEAFILQGGDCAESFQDCRSDIIMNKFKILFQMSAILLYGIRKPIICIGRIAGQYAKPRTTEWETLNNLTLPSYRGDLINAAKFNLRARIPDPQLLLQGYSYAAMTLNFIRALLKGDFYTSHEALSLHYEQSLTRKSANGLWYNLSCHLPWIGMRTAFINSSHLEFMRGIQNPIGLKVGPATDLTQLPEILHTLNPHGEEGRILLITRLGASAVNNMLPEIIHIINTNKIPVVWSCDPMHGNTEITVDGIKTRDFDKIQTELLHTINIHQCNNSHLGGVHFELTGDNVTECVGGSSGLNANDLKQAYHSLVDPRLNYEQSLEIAIQLSRQLARPQFAQ